MWENTCALCGLKGQEAEKLGVLLGPLADGKGSGQELYVHRLCALWSPEVGGQCLGLCRRVGLQGKQTGTGVPASKCHFWRQATQESFLATGTVPSIRRQAQCRPSARLLV
jgi:hypothetical protein